MDALKSTFLSGSTIISDNKLLSENLDRVSILAQIKKSCLKSNIDFHYLINLIKESHLKTYEIKKILNSSNEGIYRLWIISLLLKIRSKKQISRQYTDFYNKIIDIFIKNKIKIIIKKAEDKNSMIYASYSGENDEIHLATFENKDTSSIKFSELAAIHELYHTYQDYIRHKSPADQAETEAYIASLDYFSHAYPNNLGNSWVSLDLTRSINTMTFTIPKKTMEKLSGLDKNSPDYKKLFHKIKENYIKVKSLLYVFNSHTTKSQAQQLINSFVRKGGTKEMLENFEFIKECTAGQVRFLKTLDLKLKIFDHQRFECPGEFIRELATIVIAWDLAAEMYNNTKSPRIQTEIQKHFDEYINAYLSQVKIELTEKGRQFINPLFEANGIK